VSTPEAHPLTISLALVPQEGESAALASRLFCALRLRDEGADGTGQGLPVRFLTDPKKLGEAFAAVEGTQNVAVLVVFVDDEMAVDPAWRDALNALPKEHKGCFVYPVMVTANLTRIQPFAGRFDPLRIYNGRDTDANRSERRFGRLRRGLLDQLLRHVVDPIERRQEPTKALAPGEDDRLKVFLSHAKADGEDVALAIRDGLADAGRLRGWFDQSDLRAGMAADGDMAEAAKASTGGIVAVLSPVYPQRPWCWTEAVQARRPRQPKADLPVWVAQPGVVVSLPGGAFSSSVAALGRLPQIGWVIEGEDRPGRIAAIVDRLYLELIFSRLARIRAERRRERHGTHLFTDFVPDAWSLAHLRPALTAETEKKTLVYPGHGLRRVERIELETLASNLDLPKPIAYERLDAPFSPAPAQNGRIMAVSAGGNPQELLEDGSTLELVNEGMTRLCRGLLQRGWRLAFGGSLRPGEGPAEVNLTQTALREAEDWYEFAKDAAGEIQAPLINYVARRDSTVYTTAWRAKVLGVVELRFTHPDDQAAEKAGRSAKRREAPGRHPADDYALMRKVQSQETHGRVIMGGKHKGSSGRMPGILEEVASSIQADKPFALLGGFGGCAAILATFFASASTEWPQVLSEYADMHMHPRGEKAPVETVRGLLTGWRKGVLYGGGPVFGQGKEDWLAMMKETDLDHAVARVMAWAGGVSVGT
jgi:hypothetical protein